MTFKTPLERAIAQQIVREQEARGITQGELAHAAGIGREALNAALRGRSSMKLPTLIGVCDRLSISLTELLARAEKSLDAEEGPTPAQ